MEADSRNHVESENSSDSDAELQAAFASGALKPGLNIPSGIKRQYKRDVLGLDASYRSLQQSDLHWLQRLDVTVSSDRHVIPVAAQSASGNASGTRTPDSPATGHTVDDIDVNDDFKREMNFYRQAQLSVLEAIPRLHKLNVVTRRPDDYYAEMCKSEQHMKRVRERLVEKRSRIEHKEKVQKLRELKKHGKQIQREVLLQRQKEKTALLQSVKKHRQKTGAIITGGKPGATDRDGDELDFLNANNTGSNAISRKGNKRRDGKNKKFGFGGRKKGSKHNTARSSASMAAAFKGKQHVGGAGSKGKAMGSTRTKGNKNKRPGKQRRHKIKRGKH